MLRLVRLGLLAVIAASLVAAPVATAASPVMAAPVSGPLGASTPASVAQRRGSTPAACVPGPVARRYPARLPVRILRRSGGAFALASVCIDHAGPFVFLIDSGSSLSVVDPSLSQRFHFARLGAAGQAAGVGCKSTVIPEQVSTWSLGGITLHPQEILVAALPDLVKAQPLAGIIGSDLLSRFGAIRIDYHAASLTLGQPEEATATKEPVLRGSTGKPTPRALVTKVRVESPLTITASQEAVVALAPVRFQRSGAQSFVVDTGSAITSVASRLVRSEHLVPTGRKITLAAFGCPVTLAEVRSGAWSLGAVELRSQTLASLPASGIRQAGLLGSDLFSRYGAVVIDYAGGRLLLETG